MKKYLVIFLITGSYNFQAVAMAHGSEALQYEKENPDVLTSNINNAKTYGEYIAAVKAFNNVGGVFGWPYKTPITEKAWLAQKH